MKKLLVFFVLSFIFSTPAKGQSIGQIFDLAQRHILGRTGGEAKGQAVSEVKRNIHRILDTPARDGLYTAPGIEFNLLRNKPDTTIKKQKCIIEMVDTTVTVNSKYCDVVKVQR